MNKSKKVLLIGAVAAIIVIFAIALTSSPKQTTRILMPTTTEINKDNATKPIIKDNNIFYILNKSSLISTNTESKRSRTLYKTDGEILDFYLSPEADKAVLAVQLQDEPHNYLVEFALGKTTEIEQCLAEALAWRDQENILANCVIQTSDYDPNVTNNLVSTDQFGKNQNEIINFEFDPPKKLFIDSDKSLTLLTATSGYKTNDLYAIDTASKQLAKLTENGFITDATRIESNLYLALASRATTDNEILLVNKADKTTAIISHLASLDQISAHSGNFASLLITDGKYSVNISNLGSPDKIIKSYSLEEFAVINKIIYTGNSIIIFTPNGIDQLTNI